MVAEQFTTVAKMESKQHGEFACARVLSVSGILLMHWVMEMGEEQSTMPCESPNSTAGATHDGVRQRLLS